MTAALAIHGGPKAVTEKLPGFLDAAGRTFGAEEEALVIEALRSGCLSRNGGTMVKRLETEFAAALGLPHAVACSSGTASVHLAVGALDLEPGDEIITPPITDIGSILPSCGRTPCRCSPMSIRAPWFSTPQTWRAASRRARGRSSPCTWPDCPAP
jgi:hypothetical protein